MSGLLDKLKAGNFDRSLSALYGQKEEIASSRVRTERVIQTYSDAFPDSAAGAALFSAPGRTEIGGNHTDHQHGHVLCGSVDLDMLSCAAPKW